jgi:hypothetical protein
VIGDNALADSATAPKWADAGMPDYVNKTDPTDMNPNSTGCGMAFLSWLMSLGHGLDRIARAMVSLGDSGTLAQLYSKLTGDAASKAWPAFQAAIRANSVTDDDPFRQLDAQIVRIAVGGIVPINWDAAKELEDVILSEMGEPGC